jgi:hypothetical protein
MIMRGLDIGFFVVLTWVQWVQMSVTLLSPKERPTRFRGRMGP